MVKRGFPPDKCGDVWESIAQTWMPSLMRGFPLVNLEAHEALWVSTYLQWASILVAWLPTTYCGSPSARLGGHDTLFGHPEMRDGCPNSQDGHPHLRMDAHERSCGCTWKPIRLRGYPHTNVVALIGWPTKLDGSPREICGCPSCLNVGDHSANVEAHITRDNGSPVVCVEVRVKCSVAPRCMLRGVPFRITWRPT